MLHVARARFIVGLLGGTELALLSIPVVVLLLLSAYFTLFAANIVVVVIIIYLPVLFAHLFGCFGSKF